MLAASRGAGRCDNSSRSPLLSAGELQESNYAWPENRCLSRSRPRFDYLRLFSIALVLRDVCAKPRNMFFCASTSRVVSSLIAPGAGVLLTVIRPAIFSANRLQRGHAARPSWTARCSETRCDASMVSSWGSLVRCGVESQRAREHDVIALLVALQPFAHRAQQLERFFVAFGIHDDMRVPRTQPSSIR